MNTTSIICLIAVGFGIMVAGVLHDRSFKAAQRQEAHTLNASAAFNEARSKATLDKLKTAELMREHDQYVLRHQLKLQAMNEAAMEQRAKLHPTTGEINAQIDALEMQLSQPRAEP